MFCKNCGNRIEPGEMYCAMCGTKVSAETPAQQTAAYAAPQMQPVMAGTVAGVSKSKNKINIMVILTAVLMFFSTLRPFVNIDRGWLGNLASSAFGEYLPNFNYNLYQLSGVVNVYMSEYRYISILVISFVVITMVVALTSGILNRKGILIIAGVMSALCVLMCIAFLIYSAQLVDMFNSEVSGYSEYLGEFGDIVDGAVKVKSINGMGIYLFLVASFAQTFFTFFGAARK